MDCTDLVMSLGLGEGGMELREATSQGAGPKHGGTRGILEAVTGSQGKEPGRCPQQDFCCLHQGDPLTPRNQGDMAATPQPADAPEREILLQGQPTLQGGKTKQKQTQKPLCWSTDC